MSREARVNEAKCYKARRIYYLYFSYRHDVLRFVSWRGKRKTKTFGFFSYLCMMSCLLKILKECTLSVHDDVFRLGGSATTSCLLAQYLRQYSFLPRKAGSFQLHKHACSRAIPKPPTRTAIKKQIQIVEQQRTKNFQIYFSNLWPVLWQSVLILQLQTPSDLLWCKMSSLSS